MEKLFPCGQVVAVVNVGAGGCLWRRPGPPFSRGRGGSLRVHREEQEADVEMLETGEQKDAEHNVGEAAEDRCERCERQFAPLFEEDRREREHSDREEHVEQRRDEVHGEEVERAVQIVHLKNDAHGCQDEERQHEEHRRALVHLRRARGAPGTRQMNDVGELLAECGPIAPAAANVLLDLHEALREPDAQRDAAHYSDGAETRSDSDIHERGALAPSRAHSAHQ